MGRRVGGRWENIVYNYLMISKWVGQGVARRGFGIGNLYIIILDMNSKGLRMHIECVHFPANRLRGCLIDCAKNHKKPMCLVFVKRSPFTFENFLKT